MYKVYTEPRYYSNSLLKINGNIACLYLNEDTNYENGFAYGSLMHNEILFLINRFKTFVKPKITNEELYEVFLNLPKHALKEIQGMFDAINRLLPNKITYSDLILIQMVPELDNVGCTIYANRDDENNVILGRNMDWMPFSSAQYSIIINYKMYNINSLSVPGLIGFVTAWTKEYVVAMNVVGLKYYDNKLMPSMIYNRDLMIYSKTFNDTYDYIKLNKPMIAYHLTIANNKKVISYAFYQNKEHTYVRNMYSKNLTVLNWTYPNNDNGRYVSAYRHELTKNQKKRGIKHVIDILKACQTFETMHSVIFELSKKKIHIGIDNGFAADLLHI